jgi:hypothetical protein
VLAVCSIRIGRHALSDLVLHLGRIHIGGLVVNRILVIGQSHVRALIDGYGQLTRPDAGPAGSPEASFAICRPQQTVQWEWQPSGFVRHQVKKPVIDLVTKGAANHVAFTWGGNQMSLRALIATDRPFDVLVPSSGEEVRTDPGGELLPCSVVDSYVRQRLESNETLHQLIDAAGRRGVPAAMVIPPPPLPGGAVRMRLGEEPYFITVLEHLGLTAAEVPLVPDPVRARLWNLLAGSYRSFAARNGLEVVEPPEEAFDADGMLVEDYWGIDATHAGANYGTSVLRQLFDWASHPTARPIVVGEAE